MKKEKHFIEVKFSHLKEKFKAEELTIEEIDKLTCELIAHLAEMTIRGITDINGTPIDLYKDRVFWIVEKAGLLPGYREPEEDLSDLFEIKDNYYEAENEFEMEIDDSKFYK